MLDIDTPLPYASNITITSKENDIAACDEIDAPQYEDSGTTSVPLPTKLIIMYINKYQTIATIRPTNALVKNTLINID
jgi:hypothetical protein